MSLDSFFISKFNLVPITSEKSYPSGSRKSLGKRNAGKLSNIIIVGCNFRLNLHIHPHRFHKSQCEENGGEENVIFTIRLHICASILSHYLIWSHRPNSSCYWWHTLSFIMCSRYTVRMDFSHETFMLKSRLNQDESRCYECFRLKVSMLKQVLPQETFCQSDPRGYEVWRCVTNFVQEVQILHRASPLENEILFNLLKRHNNLQRAFLVCIEEQQNYGKITHWVETLGGS